VDCARFQALLLEPVCVVTGGVMASASCSSRIVVNAVRNGIRYAGFAPTLLLTCYAGFAAEGAVVPYTSYYNPEVVAPAIVVADNPVPTVPKPLDGLGFGAGVAVTFGQSRVNNAVAVGPNNIVRVTDNSNVLAGIVFESHYFFVPKPTYLLGSALPIQWGHGPFIAVDASTNSTGSVGVVAGISMGWMVGFKKLTRTPATVRVTDAFSGRTITAQVAAPDNNSWNFGVGFRVDPRATVLGDGIVANMPLPAGETNPVRLKTEPRYGVMLITSYGFN